MRSRDGCRADPFAAVATVRRRRFLRFNSPYGLGAFVGIVTYIFYG